MSIIADKMLILRILVAFIFFSLVVNQAFAETKLKIVAGEQNATIAVAELCDRGRAKKEASAISEALANDFRLAATFNVVSFEGTATKEKPQSCDNPDTAWFEKWASTGASNFVRGWVRVIGTDSPEVEAELSLFSASSGSPILTKHYTKPLKSALFIAHEFAAEVQRLFGSSGDIFGTRIAFIEEVKSKRNLVVSNLYGGERVQLTRDGDVRGPLAWSSDGRKIVYASTMSGRAELYIAGVQEGVTKQVSMLPGIRPGAVFFGDSKFLLAATQVSSAVELVKMTTYGRVVETYNLGGGDKLYPSIPRYFSPNVVFALHQGDQSKIVISTFLGNKSQTISPTGISKCDYPSWSPSLVYIAYSCEANGRQIFLSRFGAGESWEVPMQVTFSGNNDHPSWAPSGKLLAFRSVAEGEKIGNIRIFSLDTLKSWKIADSEVDQSFPAWSPVR